MTENAHNLKKAIVKHIVVEATVSSDPAAAVAAIKAVLELHSPMENRWTKEPVCSICVTGGATGEEPALWPCTTFEAIAASAKIPAR